MFPLTSSNIGQIQGHDASARFGRRTTPSVKIIGAAAIALLVSANTFANAAETSPRTTLEQHACAVILGLDPSGRSMTPVSGASIGAWPNGIRRDWFRPAEAHVPKRGSSPKRRLSQYVY